MQPVVSPVQPVGQPVVSYIQTLNRLSNQLFNRLYEFHLFDSCNPTSNRSPTVEAKILASASALAIMSNRLSNQIDNRLDNRLNVCLHDASVVQPV